MTDDMPMPEEIHVERHRVTEVQGQTSHWLFCCGLCLAIVKELEAVDQLYRLLPHVLLKFKLEPTSKIISDALVPGPLTNSCFQMSQYLGRSLIPHVSKAVANRRVAQKTTLR